MDEQIKQNPSACQTVEFEQLDHKHFLASYWQEHQRVVGYSSGRNQVWFIQPAREHPTWVLRHYYRGGLPGRLIKRSFLYFGVDKTRSFTEFSLLQKMRQLELPVPEPVGSYMRKQGLFYQASILIEKIPQTRDLGRLLRHQALRKEDWYELGRTLKQFHLKQVIHTDLNCKNILFHEPSRSFYLIDFDRCYFSKSKADSWFLKLRQQANLKRLFRSFNKEFTKAQKQLATFHWNAELDRQALLAGYSEG